MAIYDELRKEFAGWNDINREYWFNAGGYAARFAEGFRSYLGAPEKYKPLDGKEQSYVELCKVVERDRGPDILEPSNFRDALARKEDGFFLFGVSVTLERASNTYPKHAFGFSISILPQEKQCEMRIAGKQFALNMDDDQDRIQVYALMRQVLTDWLSKKPWDVEQQNNPIGFVYPS